MATKELKDQMRTKLTAAVQTEIKKDKITKTIDSVTVDDGVIAARFSIRMPKKEEKSEDKMSISSDTTYENFTKNFKTPEEFNQFVWEEFFNDFKTE